MLSYAQLYPNLSKDGERTELSSEWVALIKERLTPWRKASTAQHSGPTQDQMVKGMEFLDNLRKLRKN